MNYRQATDTASLARQISSDFYEDRLDLSTRGVVPASAWLRMPEVQSVSLLEEFGMPPRNLRRFLTFIAAMDRARDANVLWSNGVKLIQTHPELFEPSVVAKIPISTLRSRLSEYQVSQRHDQDCEAWKVIAISLTGGRNPVRDVVDDGVGDAEAILDCLRTTYKGRSRFPLLRGPKIGPMWVRMLVAPGRADVTNMHIIPVAVDVHVRRVTETLGVSDTRSTPLEEARPVIQGVWREAVSISRIGGPPGIVDTCSALDPALWTFGKYGCSYCYKVGKPVSISSACSSCQLQNHLNS